MRRGTTFVILLQPHKKGQEIYFSGEKKEVHSDEEQQ
jgi:hypothetical protein